MRYAMLAAAVAVAACSAVPALSAAPAERAPTVLAQVSEQKAQQAPAQKAQPPAAKPAQPPQAKPHSPAAEPGKPRPKAQAPAPRRDARIDSQECTWVGKRTIRVLMRDDLIAAEGFLKFYNTFGCPIRYLGQAFGCSLGIAEGAPAKAVENRIEVCWKDATAAPETAAAPAAQPPAPDQKKQENQKKAAPPKPAPRGVEPAQKPKTAPETAYPKR